MKEQKIPIYLRGEPFIFIPFRLIIDEDSTGADILIFLAISSFANWGTGIMWSQRRNEQIDCL